MRRRIAEEPPSRSASWSRRCALLGAACAAVAVLGSHVGLRPTAAVGLLGAAILFAVAGLLLAIVGAVVIWRTGRRGIGALVAGVALSALLLGGPAALAARTWRLPVINDVSTDTADPPGFLGTAKALAARDGVVHAPASAETVRAQAAAYPTLQPLVLDAPPAEAYAAALKLVKARHWRVLASRAPVATPATPGAIEAVARTLVMAFRDDVAIRVAAAPNGRSRVDMRSASRFGQGDLGANAARITAFLADLDDAVGGQ